MGGNKDNHVLKMVLTAIFAGMGFALSSVGYGSLIWRRSSTSSMYWQRCS